VASLPPWFPPASTGFRQRTLHSRGQSSYSSLKCGRSYVSDGKSHIIDFRVDERELGTEGSELRLAAPKTIHVTARVASYLSPEQDELGAFLAARPLDQPPYSNIERARVGTTRNVPVELVVNGEAAGRVDLFSGALSS